MNPSRTTRRALSALALLSTAGCAKTGTEQPSSLTVGQEGLESAIPAGLSALKLEAKGSHLQARFPGMKASADTRLPRQANGAFMLAQGAQHLAVRLEGAKSTSAVEDTGLVRYDNALGEGTRLVQRLTPDGTEDFVRFATAPEKAELRYQVALEDGIAGLRLVANTLEFLDASGAPRLRVNAPYGVDAKGQRFAAVLSVEGAAVDTDARAPWGRAVTAPGARDIVVSVRWANDVTYPAVVDPAWVTTNNPATTSSTWEAFAVRLTSGKVLYAAAGTASELYDPATGTWAAAGALPFTFQHRQRVVAGEGGMAWAISASTSGYPTAAFDEATGLWTATAAIPTAAQDGIYGFALTHLGGNRFFFVTGGNGSTHIYDLGANTYEAKASATAFGSYNNAGAYKLSNGKVAVNFAAVNRISFYDVATNTWTYSALNLNGGDTNCAPMVELTDGKILWYGAGGSNPNWARVYDPTTDTAAATAGFPTAPTMSHACNGPNNNISYGTKHLVAGGRFLFDEATNAATLTAAFPSGAPYHQAITKLADGRALAVGGGNTIGHNNLADIYAPSTQADCDGAPFGTVTTPVFDATKSMCAACNGDNASGATLACPSTAMPVCAASGACVACSATNLSNCTGTTPTCNTGTGVCTGATADNGSATGQACPTTAAPFAKADGSCGTCTEDGTGATGCTNGTPVHAGAFCGATSGACTNLCARDSQCGTSWCSSDTGACSAKLANSAPIPTVAGRNAGDVALNGVCSPAVGVAICASGVCSTSTNTCGLAAGEGTCTAANAATVCQSGLCSAAGVCTTASSCFSDGDCTGGWCKLSTNTCQGKLANGTAVPTDAPHTNPTLDGTCSAAAGTLVCVAGACDTADNKCGLGNGAACTGATATACRAGVCGADNKCAYADGEGSCNAGNAATVCRNGSCRSDGKCGTNSTGVDAGAPTDAGSNGGTDAGSTTKTDAGSTSGTDAGSTTKTDAGNNGGSATDAGTDPAVGAVEGGGCGCDVAGASPMGIWSLVGLGAMLLSRRRKATHAQN